MHIFLFSQHRQRRRREDRPAGALGINLGVIGRGLGPLLPRRRRAPGIARIRITTRGAQVRVRRRHSREEWGRRKLGLMPSALPSLPSNALGGRLFCYLTWSRLLFTQRALCMDDNIHIPYIISPTRAESLSATPTNDTDRRGASMTDYEYWIRAMMHAHALHVSSAPASRYGLGRHIWGRQ